MKVNVRMWSIVAVVLGGLVRLATATMVFQDQIMNYPVNSQYVADNPAVIKSQDNGGNIIVMTNLGVWATSGGNEFVNIGSGGLGAYTTLAVPINVTDRYGQIYARVGKNPTATSWMRLMMSTNSAPVLGPSDSVAVGTGADLLWDPNGFFRYANGGSQITSSAYPTAQMHDVTINYDLLTATYDVWVNTNQLVSGASFATAGFGSTVRSIALGGAYWSSDGVGAVLDQWYWSTDNATAFTSFGFFVPEPTTFALFAVGLGLCWMRRRR